MIHPETLRQLRQVLAALYPSSHDVRRVIYDAEIDGSRIDLNSSPFNSWHAILSEADKMNRVQHLLDVAASEYPSNSELVTAIQAYQVHKAEGVNSAITESPMPTGEVRTQLIDSLIETRSIQSSEISSSSDKVFHYDVTVSFAGEDRPTVERLAQLLRRNGVRVFYDAWEQSELWGKDLYQRLDAVYRLEARYCLIFVSKHYVKKAWTKHELRSAQARAFEENSEYILPIRLDDSELPGLPSTVAYLDARTTPLSEICRAFVSKLGFSPKIDISVLLYSIDGKDREKALREISFTGDLEHLERITELMLSDPVDEIRVAAAFTLDSLHDPSSLPALIDAIHDLYFDVRSAAGWALVHLGENLVRAEMERICQESDNHGARQMAILVLQNL